MSRLDSPEWRRRLAWAATAAAVWLLFWPFAPDMGGRRVAGFDKAIHAWLFGGLAWAWGRVLGAVDAGAAERKRRWTLAGGLAAATVVVEVAQPLTGRGFDLLDAAAGCAGIAATTLLRGARFGWLAAALFALGVGWMARGLWLLGTEWRAFPVLAAGGGGCWAEDWHLRGVTGESTPEGLRMVLAPEGPKRWRGAFRVPARRDWSRLGDWVLRVDWGGTEETTLVVRLDDRRQKMPPYAERFQREWRVSPGWNELVIPRAEWTRTSGGSPLDASDIARWGVFLLTPADFEHWTLGQTQLEPPNERPSP